MQASIKRWSAGAPIQAALDALETLMRAHDIGAAMSRSLTVRLPDDRVHLVDDRAAPDLCVQHLLAVLLLDRGLGFRAAHDRARMRDPAVRALRARIRLVPDAGLTRALPPRQAIVEIALRDGARSGTMPARCAARPTIRWRRTRSRRKRSICSRRCSAPSAPARWCGDPADRAADLGARAAAAAAGLRAQGRYMPPLTWIVWPVM